MRTEFATRELQVLPCISASALRALMFSAACLAVFIIGLTWSVVNAFAEARTHLEAAYTSNSRLPALVVEGFHDGADCDKIFGWAWDSTQPNAALSVDIYDGSIKIATVSANQFRSDLSSKGNGFHAFNFPTPASLKNGQSHSITVKFANTQFNLSNTPKSFTCSLPDLTTTANVNSSYSAGQTVQVPTTVSRSGGQIPNTSNFVLARLYWSTNSTFGSGDTQLWESNGSTPDYPVSVLNSSGSKSVNATITIPNVSAGNYFILAFVDPTNFYSESNEGNNVTPYAVSVAVSCTSPSITSQPVDQTINSGQQAGIVVSATGSTPLSFQWYRGSTGDTSNPVSGATSASFTTPVLTSTTTYWVRISNSCGSVNSRTVTVNVNPPACTSPSITNQPVDQTINSGQQAGLVVSATGSTPLSFQWYRGSAGDTSNPVNGATSASFTTPVLTITTTYWVRINNSCGSVNSRTVTVNVNSASLEGFHDGADCDKIFGWAWDSTQPNAVISVDIYDGPNKLATVLANEFRSDLTSKGNGFHAFNYLTPASLRNGQSHNISVKFSSTSANLASTPRSITCPVSANPIISVNPSSGPQQTTTFITSGSGFTPNGQVRRFLTFPNTTTAQEIAGTTANSLGQFSISFTSNCSSSVGTYTEYFIDVATGRQSNNATETITASAGCSAPVITINPQSGPQLNSTFVISGSGFTANGAVRQLIVFPNGITQEVSGTTANSQGQINKQFTTDCATMVGSHTIWMIDVVTGKESTRAQEVVTASSGCTSTPVLAVSQTSGTLGTTFGYSGTGFTRNSTATLTVTRADGLLGSGGRFNSDSSGNVFFVITSLSTDPTGTWTMQLKDDSTGRQASVSVQYTNAQQTGTDIMYYTDSTVDVTIPDNTQLAPGETKNKVWRIQNAGTNTWTNYKLVFIQGIVRNHQSVNLSNVSSIAVSAAPGQWINTPNLPITAPTSPGTYYSYWQMQNSNGVNFGAQIYVLIRVVPPQRNTLAYGSRQGAGDSLPSKSGHNADPVNTATGNYNYESTDLSVPGRGLDFDFGRAYNSQDSTRGPLGTGWSHTFNIYVSDIGSDTPSVHYSDGKVLTYLNQQGTNNYQSSYPGYYDQLSKNADNTWTLKKTDQRTYRFSANGKLTAILDRNGNQLTLGYDGSGNLSQVIDTVGRPYTLSYSGSLITSVTDPVGRKLQFGYDGASNLTSFRDANNILNSYLYDANNRLTRIIDGRGNNLLVNAYDGSSRVGTQTNGRGNLWSFIYNSDGSTSVFDPNNPAADSNSKPIKYTHDTNFNMQREADRLSNQVDVRYDDRNNRSQVSDLKNNYFSYQYDANGNVTAHTNPLLNTWQAIYDAKNNPTRVTDEMGTHTLMSYDGNGNLVNVTDALGNIITTTYDLFGQPLVTTDANGNKTTKTYDAHGNLASVKDALNNTTTYSYDLVGRRTGLTDARGKMTTYTYDANDNLLTVTDHSGRVTTYTYDANNNRTSVRDPRGNTTRFDYDENNLLVKETDPTGNSVQHTYDKLDRRISTRDKRGNVISFAYDNEGRVISVNDPIGNVTSYSYDANGNRTEIKDPKGQPTIFTYDPLNRVTRIQDPLGNNVRKEYDAAGRVIRQIDPRGNATQFSYDVVGNLTQVVDAEGGSAKYAYDKNRNRINQNDPRNNTSGLSYDGLNRLVSSQDPLSNVHSYAYDAVGNRVSQTDAIGRTIRFEYDASNRLSTITYPDSTTVRLTYDLNSNVTQMVDSLGTSNYSYDPLNRLTSYTDAFGKTLSYLYDPNGNVIRLTYPDGKQVTYQYDAANRLISLSDWANKITSYQYDSASLVTKITYPNGTTTTFGYDNVGRLTSKSDDPAISSYSLTLDANSNRTAASIKQPLATLPVNTSQASLHDNANRIQSSGNASFNFDANGNMTSKLQDGVTTNYVYDFNDRLTAVSGGTQYFYNGNGIRLRKIEGGIVTGYVVDTNRELSQVLCETDGSGNITSYYVYGLGLVYKVTPSDTHYYYHFDALGSTVAMTDDAKSIVNAYAYDPFGKVINNLENTMNSFKYVGQMGITQESNGLLFMRARYYLPEFGRFLNKDPITGTLNDSQGLNLYLYTNNNPVTFVDPTGLFLEYGSPEYRFTNWVDSRLSQAYVASVSTVPSFTLCGFTLGRAEGACRNAGYSEAQIAVSKDIGTVGIYVATGAIGGTVLKGVDYFLQGKGLADVMLRLQRGQISPEDAIAYAMKEATSLGLNLTFEGLVQLLGKKFPIPTETLNYLLNKQLTKKAPSTGSPGKGK